MVNVSELEQFCNQANLQLLVPLARRGQAFVPQGGRRALARVIAQELASDPSIAAKDLWARLKVRTNRVDQVIRSVTGQTVQWDDGGRLRATTFHRFESLVSELRPERPSFE
jgi:hypothetical protein